MTNATSTALLSEPADCSSELADQRDHQRHARGVHRGVEPALGARGRGASGGSGCGARARCSTTPTRLITTLAMSTTVWLCLIRKTLSGQFAHVGRRVEEQVQRQDPDRHEQVGRRSRCGGRRGRAVPCGRREQRVHASSRCRRELRKRSDGEQDRDVRSARGRPQNQAKPVATISEPRLLSGRRAQANSPAPMNPQPITSPSTATGAAQVGVVARQDRARRR